MARTGPQKIPGASQAYFYGTGQYSGSDMEVNCGVAHTTEGRSLPGYNGGAEAPTVTGVPDCKAKKIRWYQHYDVDESARALMNKLGGVQTNTANVFQFELVGTCDPKTRDAWVRAGYRQDVDFIFWPEAPDWALSEVAWLVRWLNTNHKVPLTCVKDWIAYGKDPRRPGVTPASYGANPARMSFEQWRSFTGWCGHQHVPENDHGDPGSMDFPRVIALAKGETPEEDDMPLSVDDLEKIRKVVWESDKFAAPKDAPDYATNKTWQGQSYVKDTNSRVRSVEKQLAALTEANKQLVGTVGQLAGQMGDLDPAAIVAELSQALESIQFRIDVPDQG